MSKTIPRQPSIPQRLPSPQARTPNPRAADGRAPADRVAEGASLQRAVRLGHRVQLTPCIGTVCPPGATLGTRGEALQRQAARPVEVRSRGVGNRVQRAGHPEDIVVFADWVLKRIDRKEYEEYLRYSENPESVAGILPEFEGPWAVDDRPSVEDLEDHFLGPIDTTQNEEGVSKRDRVQGILNDTAHWVILLENVTRGMEDPRMRDVKMGSHTASGTDQVAHEVKGISKGFKILRHDLLDMWGPSRKYGFRDEDAQKEGKMKTSRNLSAFRDWIANNVSEDSREAILYDLRNVWGWLTFADTVYVGSSIMLAADPATGQGKARLIDLEHPVKRSDPGGKERFRRYKIDLKKGVSNLIEFLSKSDVLEEG